MKTPDTVLGLASTLAFERPRGNRVGNEFADRALAGFAIADVARRNVGLIGAVHFIYSSSAPLHIRFLHSACQSNIS